MRVNRADLGEIRRALEDESLDGPDNGKGATRREE